LPKALSRRVLRDGGGSIPVSSSALGTSRGARLVRRLTSGPIAADLEKFETEGLDRRQYAVQRRLVGQRSEENRFADPHLRIKASERAE
jgi:hypothetical protein